jgi:hypothetical protein
LKQFLKKQKPRPRGQWPSSHTHTLWHALKPNSAQAAMRGGEWGKRRIQKEHGPKGLRSKNKAIVNACTQKNVLHKAPLNFR